MNSTIYAKNLGAIWGEVRVFSYYFWAGDARNIKLGCAITLLFESLVFLIGLHAVPGQYRKWSLIAVFFAFYLPGGRFNLARLF